VAKVGIEAAVIDAQDPLQMGRAAGIAVERQPGRENLFSELRIAERGVDDGIDAGAGRGCAP
jgi:hypothetical protein